MDDETKSTCPMLASQERKGSVEEVLLDNRRLYIYGEINTVSAQELVKAIRYLNIKNTTDPIILEINSGGGDVCSGFAIVNAIKQSQAKIITVINGIAASMAGIISVAGDVRVVMPNSWWMAHDVSGGITGDYSKKVEYRAAWLQRHWKQLESHLKTFTKLTVKDIEQARNGELWLDYKECCKKKVTDYIIMKTENNFKAVKK